MLADEAVHGGGDLAVADVRKAALGFLIEQDAGDDVVLCVAAELRIALTAGDAAHAFELSFDRLELLVDQVVRDRLAVYGNGHEAGQVTTGAGAPSSFLFSSTRSTRPYSMA